MKAIIILVLLLVLFGGIIVVALYLRARVRKFSKEIFGTEDITQSAKQMRQEYAATPKSVSAMTSLLLPKIVSDFPDFAYDEMKGRSDNVLTSYLRAVDQNDVSLLQDGNQELKNQLENHIEGLRGAGEREYFDNIHIHRTEITSYRKQAGRCIITFQTSLECMHYSKDAQGKVIQGSTEYKYQTKYNTDLIYIQDRNLVENELDDALGVNCPNCGAPISNLGAKVCEYCGTPVIELNIHAWSFSHLEEIK